MGVAYEKLVHVCRGGLLHDIGKVSIRDAIQTWTLSEARRHFH